jgi:hypothetical protein
MIRFIVGLLIVFGVAGGLDGSSDSDLKYLIAAAVVGLLFMLSGANSLEKKID